MNARNQIVIVASVMLLLGACGLQTAQAQITYTFPDTDEHLMATLTNGGANLNNINDQAFQITNNSGEDWTGFRLRLEATDYLGIDFCCEGISDYTGGGFAIYSNPDGDSYGRTEKMGVYLNWITDGSVYSFTVDLTVLPPEGATDMEIFGDPTILFVRHVIYLDVPLHIGDWGDEAMMAAGMPVTLVNATGTTWNEYRLRLAATDQDGEPFLYARFEDTDGNQEIYSGPGDPEFLDPNGIDGDEVLHITNLVVPPDDELTFTIDFACFPPAGMDSLSLIGQAVPDLTSIPGEDTPAPAMPVIECAPNPFNPRTTLSFRLPQAADVSITIYDVAGRCLRKVLARHFEAGEHSVEWDGRDDQGRRLPSGSYLARFRAGDHVQTLSIELLK
jgi:hypothetical protein